MGEAFSGLRAVARVLVMNEAGELLLCRNREGNAWVPPGGTLDPGESLPEAAAREAEEEAGILVTVGPLLYLQEYRPAFRPEHVINIGFRATARQDRPADALLAARQIEPAGPPERPWGAWFITDVDGPRREVRWFTREQLAAMKDPVYPPFLRDQFWQVPFGGHNPYLGLSAPVKRPDRS